MNKLISFFKRIRLSQILTVFLAGILLLVSTACGGGGQLQAGTSDKLGSSRQEVPSGLQDQKTRAGDNPRPEVPEEAAGSSFRKGGMNEYSDVDPRTDVAPANTKAKALIDKTERNVIDQTDDVGTNTRRILDKKGENAEHFGQNVKETTESSANSFQKSANDFIKGTQKGTENIKQNTEDFAKNPSKTADKPS